MPTDRHPNAYQLELAAMWAAGRCYGPRADDLPGDLGSTPEPAQPKEKTT